MSALYREHNPTACALPCGGVMRPKDSYAGYECEVCGKVESWKLNKARLLDMQPLRRELRPERVAEGLDTARTEVVRMVAADTDNAPRWARVLVTLDAVISDLPRDV